MTGSFRDLCKRLETAFAQTAVNYPLDQNLVETIEHFLEKHSTLSTDSGSRLQDELISLYTKEVEPHADQKLAAFISCLTLLRPALYDLPALDRWFEVVKKPAISSAGYKLDAVHAGRDFLLRVLIYERDCEDEKINEKELEAARDYVRKLLFIYLEKSKVFAKEQQQLLIDEESHRFLIRNVQDILVSFGEKRSRLFFDTVDEFFVKADFRLQILNLCSSLVSKQTPFLYEVCETPFLDHLFKSLLYDKSTSAVEIASGVLVMIMPHIASILGQHLPTLYAILIRLTCWDLEKAYAWENEAENEEEELEAGSQGDRETDGYNNNNSDDNDDKQTLGSSQETDQSIPPDSNNNNGSSPTKSTSSDDNLNPQGWQELGPAFFVAQKPEPPNYGRLFTFLYGMFPNNLCLFLRSPVKTFEEAQFSVPHTLEYYGKDFRERSVVLLERHRAHPMLITSSADLEINDKTRWERAGLPEDIACSCIALDTERAHSRLRPSAVSPELYGLSHPPQVFPEISSPPSTKSLHSTTGSIEDAFSDGKKLQSLQPMSTERRPSDVQSNTLSPVSTSRTNPAPPNRQTTDSKPPASSPLFQASSPEKLMKLLKSPPLEPTTVRGLTVSNSNEEHKIEDLLDEQRELYAGVTEELPHNVPPLELASCTDQQSPEQPARRNSNNTNGNHSENTSQLQHLPVNSDVSASTASSIMGQAGSISSSTAVESLKPVGNGGFDPTEIILAYEHRLAFFQRELLLSRNELSFEVFLKRQHLSHIKSLRGELSQMRREDIGLQGIVMNNKALKRRIAYLEQEFTRQRELATVFKAERLKYEEQLVTRNRELKSSNDSLKVEIEMTTRELSSNQELLAKMRHELVDKASEALKQSQAMQVMKYSLDEYEEVKDNITSLKEKIGDLDVIPSEQDLDEKQARIEKLEIECAKLKRQHEVLSNDKRRLVDKFVARIRELEVARLSAFSRNDDDIEIAESMFSQDELQKTDVGRLISQEHERRQKLDKMVKTFEEMKQSYESRFSAVEQENRKLEEQVSTLERKYLNSLAREETSQSANDILMARSTTGSSSIAHESVASFPWSNKSSSIDISAPTGDSTIRSPAQGGSPNDNNNTRSDTEFRQPVQATTHARRVRGRGGIQNKSLAPQGSSSPTNSERKGGKSHNKSGHAKSGLNVGFRGLM